MAIADLLRRAVAAAITLAIRDQFNLGLSTPGTRFVDRRRRIRAGVRMLTQFGGACPDARSGVAASRQFLTGGFTRRLVPRLVSVRARTATAHVPDHALPVDRLLRKASGV